MAKVMVVEMMKLCPLFGAIGLVVTATAYC